VWPSVALWSLCFSEAASSALGSGRHLSSPFPRSVLPSNLYHPGAFARTSASIEARGSQYITARSDAGLLPPLLIDTAVSARAMRGWG
jgi:hypothetical protein